MLVEVARPNATATNVEQRFYSVAHRRQAARRLLVLKQRGLTQALVFVNSKLGCARLARSLERDGLKTTALHGDKSQDERLKALDAFKRGDVDVMVATDVAARGLDIVDLPVVFNFDVPYNAEDYIHRIGRTGRAGASGLAVTLVSRDDARLVGDIEKLIKKKIEIEPLELDEERPPRFERPHRRPEADAGERAETRRAPGRPAYAGGAAARTARPVLRPALRVERRRGAGLGEEPDGAGGARPVAEHQDQEARRRAVRRRKAAD